MLTVNELSLAEIVTQKPEAAALLEKYHLDFCCKGKRKLSEALKDNEEVLNIVTAELNNLFNQQKADVSNDSLNKLSLSELVDYIISRHHTYVKEALPMIAAHLHKVAEKHGQRFPEMIHVFELFEKVKWDLEEHMMKEEMILFPGIKKLELFHKTNPEDYFYLNLKSPIHTMEYEHEHVGKILEEIRNLTLDYSPPADACTTFRLVIEELRRFEEDLHLHVHAENNILFPKAIKLQAVQL